MKPMDPLMLGVLSHYFRAAAEAMGFVLQRTAYSSYVKESNDFATGLLTPQGEQFAYSLANGTQGFVGLQFGRMIEELAPWHEGDVAITNCPYESQGVASHLPDYNMIKPIFVEGRLLAFAWCFVHASDAGGIVAGSILPSATEIFQEGLRIPPLKLYRAGVLQEDVRRLMMLNVRIPEKNWGDLNAMIAALATGEQRVQQAAHKWGGPTVLAAGDALIAYAERRARALLDRIAEGDYAFVDYLEDDLVSDMPIRIKLKATKEPGGGMHLDFTGSDPQVNAAFNLASNGRHPYLCGALFGYFRSMDPLLPINAGLMRPIRITAPKGSVMNASLPAACGVRFAVAQTIYGVVQSVLAQALPREVPAVGAGQASIIAVSLMDMASGARRVTVVQPMIGGSGGRRLRDGIDGCDFSQGSLSNTPIEAIENEIPIQVKEYSVVPDSGGAGEFRGGMAFRLDFSVFHSDAIVTARGMERFKFQPRGFLGGAPGANGDCWLNPGTANARRLGKINALTLEPGDVLSVRTPGGGGYGDPLNRSSAAVLADVRNGLITPEAAKTLYGVSIVAGQVDEPATAAARRAFDGVRYGEFEPGPARAAHEALFTLPVADALAEVLYALPAGLRYSAKAKLFKAIRAQAASGETVTPSTVRRLKSMLFPQAV
jgi:N-methylhydantoinase B